MSNFVISNFSVVPFEEEQAQTKNTLLVTALGYERRSSHFARLYGANFERQHALGFDHRKECSFQSNFDVLKSIGFDIHEASGAQFAEVVRTIFSSLSDAEEAKIWIDISSFSRSRIAHMISEVWSLQVPRITLYLCYSPAKYSRPIENAGPINIAEPVTPQFAGWTSTPEAQVALLLGLNNVPERAIGIAEFFQPGDTWVFFPTGEDHRFDSDVESVNREVLHAIPQSNLVRYPVSRPDIQLADLLSLINGLSNSFRPILVPLGPKIFTAVSLIASAVFDFDIGVWRISEGKDSSAIDVEASREPTIFRLSLMKETSG